MSEAIHPLAPHSLPPFVGGADGSDPLFSAIIFIVIFAVLGIGVFYLKLHAIPEQLAHKHSNTQSQLIMVLALLALFTHNNIFWVAALILALLKLPDFLTPINSISESLKKLTADQSEQQNAAVEKSGEEA
jgi:choline-glycine betaine transporter